MPEHAASPDHTLDAREIDGEPFGPIMEATDELGPEETLLLINSFEPVPLYDVLDQREFDHTAREADGVWHIEIERK